ncbi:hypothetical protein [Deinococcus cellulosilyticus]|uniref:Uncharacterized protein n=1 Tax=Deinococcus cellulosilyticus (strain DSM 18568 / NBRC 106333 / KACC 11606 / 5516J-15) TaxID=1223518 RepID=A0A511N9B4_DEIC1|nr:hypothetical protein [Deinococcus cellulosilyticus]GEM49106.1 hypothetical protein DC3_47410 [Deinococcus cellulosilyticus NBRC 106333 = KACC 11606]
MPPIQIKDGHLPVFQVLSRMGISRPAQFWKQLLGHFGDARIPHTRMQFEMADGRKSRMVPAIRQEDLGSLLERVREMSGEGQTEWFYLPAERYVVDLLTEAYADQQPESPCVVQGVRVDVYFHRCKVAVIFAAAREAQSLHIQNLQQDRGVRVVHTNVYHKDFRLGALVREVRSIIDLKT